MSTVGGVMLRHPKTLAARASIDEARVALADDHVHMVLLMDDRDLVGTLVRADLAGAECGTGPALPWSTLVGRTVPPHADIESVQRLLLEGGLRRRRNSRTNLGRAGLLSSGGLKPCLGVAGSHPVSSTE